MRPDQVTFMRHAQAAGHTHLVGGLREVQQWLVDIGLAGTTGNGGFMLYPAVRA
jgi:hypothetical protein